MLRIFDAHVHLFDCKANTYAFLEHEDRSFKAIAGEYSALPRRYLTDDYLNGSASCEVEDIVWYEFLSANPVREARWPSTWQIPPISANPWSFWWISSIPRWRKGWRFTPRYLMSWRCVSILAGTLETR